MVRSEPVERRSVKPDERLGKYACLELERRYLLRSLPPNLQERGWLILDRYINGTRLRLRRMAPLEDGEPLYKLGQKYRAPGQSAAETTITNIYLNRAECERLTLLDAAELIKKRYHYRQEGWRYSIDVFEGALQGLILAEIEYQTMVDCQELPFPSFAHAEVTEDPFFNGGNLATLSRMLLQAKLANRFDRDQNARS